MFRKTITALFFLYYVVNSFTTAKIFERCELARDLANRGIPRNDILEWVCIAEFESTFNTEAINHSNVDGSWDWGLFQLNDRFWCDSGKPTSNICQTSCNNFLLADITISFNCAQRIKNDQGFTAWVAWNNSCQGNVPSKQQTAQCF